MIKIIDETDITMRAHDMEIGQIGIMKEGSLAGSVILRTNSGIVCICNPKETWSINCDLEVELIPKGQKITVEYSND